MLVKSSKKGFTLIEIVMVIVIIGILAVVAIPQFFNISSDADDAAEEGVLGAVRSGIMTYQANFLAGGGASPGWPASLGGSSADADCGVGACFGTVLSQGGVNDDSWSNSALDAYTGPGGGTYTYDSADGTFD